MDGLSAARVAEAAAFATTLLQAMPAKPKKGLPVHLIHEKEFARAVVFAVRRLVLGSSAFPIQQYYRDGNTWLHAFAMDLHAVATSSTASKLHAFQEARARAGAAPEPRVVFPLRALFAEPSALLGIVLSVIFAALKRTEVCGVAVPLVQTWRRVPKVVPTTLIPSSWVAGSGMTDTVLLGLLFEAGFVKQAIDNLARLSRQVVAVATVLAATADALLVAATLAAAQFESDPALVPLADAQRWGRQHGVAQLLCVLSVWHPVAKTPWAWLACVGHHAAFHWRSVGHVARLLENAAWFAPHKTAWSTSTPRVPRPATLDNAAAVDLLFKRSSVSGMVATRRSGVGYKSDGTAVHGDGSLRTTVRQAVMLLGGACSAMADKDEGEPTSSKRHHGDGAYQCARAVLAYMAANGHVFVTPEDTWTELLEGLCGCL